MAIEAATNRKHGTRRHSSPRHGRRPTEPPAPPPPPANIEVAPEGTSGETVNQKRLREFYDLQEVFLETRRRYFVALQKIQDLIIGGAEITQGTYKVSYGVHNRRHPKYKQALIDAKGEDYQKRILERTAPHQYFRVRVS